MKFLREKRILLIADSIDSIGDDQVLSFLQEIPHPSKVIVTDRRAVHGLFSIYLSELSLRDAMQMIQVQCRQDVFGGRLKLNSNQMEDLAYETGGIPLAIIWTLDRIGATGCDHRTVIQQLYNAELTPVLDFLFKDSYTLTTVDSRLVLAALHLIGKPVEGTRLAYLLGMKKDEVTPYFPNKLHMTKLLTHNKSA